MGETGAAQFTGAEAAAVPQPRPVTVAASLPEGVAIGGVGKVAHSVGVVVHFGAADITTGDTNAKRNMGICTRHWGLRGLRAPARHPSVKDGPALSGEPLARSCPHVATLARCTDSGILHRVSDW